MFAAAPLNRRRTVRIVRYSEAIQFDGL